MAIQARLKTALDAAGVEYEVHEHAQAFTAQELAQVQHVPGREMAKVVILKVDGRPAMAVLPASMRVSWGRLHESLGAREVALASESDFESWFPECEVGAMPPFGSLFGLRVFVDPALAEDVWIYFNGGNHRQTVRMRYDDWKEIEQPIVAALGEAFVGRHAA